MARRRRAHPTTDSHSASGSDPPTLEEALEQLKNLGERDPRVVEEKLIQRYGAEWLLEQAKPRLGDWIATMFKQSLNADRRSIIARIGPEQITLAAELKQKEMWVPLQEGGYGYMRVADATPEDFERRGNYQIRLGVRVIQHGQWYLDTAALMRQKGCAVAGELDEFPELPDAASLELPPPEEVVA